MIDPKTEGVLLNTPRATAPEYTPPPPAIGDSLSWTADIVRSDRYSVHNGGTVMGQVPRGYPAQTYSDYVKARDAAAAPLLSEGALDAIGKTKIAMEPAEQYTGLMPEETEAPERQVGFAEGMLGGLVEAFTGALPGWARDPIVGLAQGVGQVADIPLGVLGNVPVNELFGLENVQGAFDLLPMTAEKQRIKEAALRDPTEANWMMAQYLRAHATDYAEAKGLPIALSGLILPQATLLERGLMLLGVPAMALSRTVAGAFGRAQEVIANPDIGKFNPALGAARERYLAGEFGPVGSKEALDRFTDEITQIGAGWSDDPFVGMLAEMVTDPLIWASFGTGAALGAVRVGALAERAAIVGRIARSSADNTVKGAVAQVDNLLQSQGHKPTGNWGLRTPDYEYRFADEFAKTPAGRPIVEQATAELPGRSRALISIKPAIEAAARGSELLNEPLKLFGSDRIGRVVSSRFHRNAAQGFFAGHGVITVSDISRAVPDDLRAAFDEANGAALAYRVQAMTADNLGRHLRSNLRDPVTGKPVGMHVLPDTLDDVDASVARARNEGNPLEAQQLEQVVRRTKTDYIPNLGALEGGARQLEYDRQMGLWEQQAVEKLAYALGTTPQIAKRILGKATPEKLGYVDEVHWGRVLIDRKRIVKQDLEYQRQILQQAQQDVRDGVPGAELALEQAESTFQIIARNTLVGPRELTAQQAADLLARLDAATTLEDKVSIVNEAMATKEYIYQTLYEKTRVTTDQYLVDRFRALLDDGLQNERFVVVISEDRLPPGLRAFRDQLRTRGMEYEMGLAPEATKRWRPTIDPDSGAVIGYTPWVSLDVGILPAKGPGKLTLARELLTTPIRGEAIVWESRRKFVREGVRRYNLNRGEALALWEAVRKEARDIRITARGFTPEEFKRITRDVNISDASRQSLGPRGLAQLTARAMEGDLHMVGLTTKVSGKAKTLTTRGAMSNFFGMLGERLYPLMRFKMNAVFLAQEFIEPYFFNILRGVKPGFNWSADNLDMHTLLDEWNMAENLADGMESREFMMMDAFRAHSAAGPNTAVAKLMDDMDFGPVQKRKRINYYNLTRDLFGSYLHQAFEAEFPGQWSKIAAFFNDLDKAQGGNGNLTRGQVAMRYFNQKGMYDPNTAHTQVLHFDGAAPDTSGNVRGIRTSYVAKAMGFESATKLRAAALDPTNPLDEFRFRESLIEAGFTPQYAARAWAVTTGVTPDEARASIARGYADPVVGAAAADTTMQVLQVMANSKMLSLDEYVARKFSAPGVWLAQNARLPYNAYAQTMRDVFDEFGFEYIEKADPRVEQVRMLALDMRPADLRPKLERRKHIEAMNAVQERGSAAVPDGMGRVVGRRKVGDLVFDLDATPEELKLWVVDALGGEAQVVGASQWYSEVPSVFVSFVESLPDETISRFAALMNEHMKSVVPIDLTDAATVKQHVSARMLMAWSATQVRTSPSAGFGYILKMIDAESQAGRLRRAVPGKGGIATAGHEAQLFRMLRDFESNLTAKGMAVKIHDFTDGNVGSSTRHFMRDTEGGSFDTRQPVAGDVWAMRGLGIIDKEMVEALTLYVMKTMDGYGDKAIARQHVLDSLGLTDETLNTLGKPTELQYEFITQKYNDVAAKWNEDRWLLDERGGREWTAADVQAVEWVRIQKALLKQPDTMWSAIGKNAVDVAFDFVPERHLPIRQAYGDALARLTPEQRDYVSRNIAYDLAAIVAEETGVTLLRKQPGWGNHQGIVSANTTYSFVGTAKAIDDTLDSLSLLTQARAVYATTSPGKLSHYVSDPKKGRHWGIDFVPESGDVRTLEALRMWLDGQHERGLTPYEQRRAAEGVVPEGSRYLVASPRGRRNFATSLQRAKKRHPFGAAVSDYGADFYARGDVTLFRSADGKGGVAVTADGDLISVHKDPGSKADIKDVIAASARMATRLDAFDINGKLPDLYGPHGFRPVARIRFDEQYMPDGWNLQRMNHPDVVFMVKDVDGVTGLPAVPSPENGGWASIRESVPYFDDYDAAAKAQADAVERAAPARPAENFRWHGSMNAMDSETLRSSLRTIYEEVENGADLATFERAAPVPQDVAARLSDGTWALDMGLEDAVPVATERRLHVVKSRLNDYDADEARAAQRIEAGEDSSKVYAEEMGRGVHAAMRKRGSDGLRERVVGRHLDSITTRADESIKHANERAHAAGRGALGLRESADVATGNDNSLRLQYSPRGWRGATAYDRGRTTAESVARGQLSGRRGTVYLKTGKADVTTPVHEVFHLFADDLDPSAVRTIHEAWWAAQGPQAARRGIAEPVEHNILVREAEEWVAAQFEEWTATGIAPSFDPTLNAVFQTYAQYWNALNPGRVAGHQIDPQVQGLFDGLVPDKHRGPAASFNVDEYRWMEAARIALQRAEDEAFRVHYYKRGRGLLERSINHPYLGMYPASYMWGKVLPELLRFLVREPFGVDAPLAGMAMANHVYEALQLQMNTDGGELADLVARFPEALRFIQLMVPGTPWDIPVNAPAWTRRLVQDAWSNEPINPGKAISDTVAYAFGPGRVPNDVGKFISQTFSFTQGLGDIIGGTYETVAEKAAREEQERVLQMRGQMAPPTVEQPRLNPDGVIQ